MASQGIKSDGRVLLPSSEAVKIAGFSRQHLQRLLTSAQVEGVKVGHDWLIYEDSLRAFLATPRKSGPKGPRTRPPVDASEQEVRIPEGARIFSRKVSSSGYISYEGHPYFIGKALAGRYIRLIVLEDEDQLIVDAPASSPLRFIPLRKEADGKKPKVTSGDR